MTKRRWLKAALKQSEKPQAALPWTRSATPVDPAVLARRPAVDSKGASV